MSVLSAPQLSNKMPGNLIGLDVSGTQMALGSLGMIAVELLSDNGEELQVADNKSVEVELALADNQLDKAPATVPLWSFDEEKGYWVEEGVATKQGNVYVASLTAVLIDLGSIGGGYKQKNR